jgi:hypothetical protein
MVLVRWEKHGVEGETQNMSCIVAMTLGQDTRRRYDGVVVSSQ